MIAILLSILGFSLAADPHFLMTFDSDSVQGNTATDSVDGIVGTLQGPTAQFTAGGGKFAGAYDANSRGTQ